MASATSEAEYYQANRDSILKKQKRYRDTHKDEIRLLARPTIKRTGSKFESIKKVGEKEIGKESDKRQKSAILK